MECVIAHLPPPGYTTVHLECFSHSYIQLESPLSTNISQGQNLGGHFFFFFAVFAHSWEYCHDVDHDLFSF
jgi:hypothetical protein